MSSALQSPPRTGFTELVATAIANAGAQAEVAASRARIVAAADQARRQIERDLHDGAQQRLVSLELQLRAARAAVPPDLGAIGTDLEHIEAGLADALGELREIARVIHPAILADGGLRAALRALARRSPIPVDLTVGTGGRLPEQAEVSAYYVVAEALTNAGKHARASAVGVEVEVAGAGQSRRAAGALALLNSAGRCSTITDQIGSLALPSRVRRNRAYWQAQARARASRYPLLSWAAAATGCHSRQVASRDS